MFKWGSVSSSGQWLTAGDKHSVLGVKRPFFFHAGKKKISTTYLPTPHKITERPLTTRFIPRDDA